MTDRYHRQRLVPDIGDEGQESIGACCAALVGIGALGSAVADHLVRAGVGSLIVIDRDVVEESNLQRQCLFDEEDVAAHRPKAIAATERLARINSRVKVHAHVEDLVASNALRLLAGADLLIDGLDNFPTRYLLNDISVAHHVPLVFGGVVATRGNAMTILPRAAAAREPWSGRISWRDDQATPCLRCLFPEPPPPGTAETCDTAGVLAPTVATVAAMQAMDAIKLMAGRIDAVQAGLTVIDLWNRESRTLSASSPMEACPCCGDGTFAYLDAMAGQDPTTLCGQDAVQVPGAGEVDLDAVGSRLASHGEVTVTPWLVRTALREEGLNLTCFQDGRVVVHGTTDAGRARAICARFIGA